MGKNKKVAYIHRKIKESIYWGSTITTITESYTVATTCIFVNTLYVRPLPFNFLVHMGNCWRDHKLNSNATLWSHKPGVPTRYDSVHLQELGQVRGAWVQKVLRCVLRKLRYRQRKGHPVCIFPFLFQKTAGSFISLLQPQYRCLNVRNDIHCACPDGYH